MPKDEFDFDDPMELNGVGIFCSEDTTDAMAECFIEEFIRLGYNHKQLLALFRNPHYLGMNLVLQNRGEEFVRDKIGEIFARWGRTVHWSRTEGLQSAEAVKRTEAETIAGSESSLRDQSGKKDAGLTDPMGVAAPDLTL